MDKDEVTELIKAIHNRCHIYLLICNESIAEGALPTLLEDIYEDCETIIDSFCTEESDA